MIQNAVLVLVVFFVTNCSTLMPQSQEQALSELNRGYKTSAEADELFLLKSQNSLTLPHNRSEAQLSSRKL